MVRLRPDYQHHKPPRFAYLRSFLPYLILLAGFSFFLSSLALLNHFRSPAKKQQIGWQSWDVVESSSSKGSQKGGQASNDTKSGEDEDFIPSIPLDNWDPLAVHTTGLTEIAVKPCYFPPWIFPSYCAPSTTGELDKTKGKWVIVEKDLNVRTGLWYLNIYYRRTRRLDAPLITDLRILPEPPTEEQSMTLEGWTQAPGDLHSGVWPSQKPLCLWYKLSDQTWDGWKSRDMSSKRQYVDQEDFITEVDVVYGDSEPWFGFERVQGGKIMEAEAKRWESVGLAYRKGNPVPPKAPSPAFHADGKFKIMQIADLHYSVGDGECKDTDKSPCVGDPDTAKWLEEALDAEKPDMVVFSGDQLNGQTSSYDSRSVLAKFAKPVIDRKIVWAAIFGNHDSEDGGDRAYQMRLLQNLPYSLAKPGPENIDGVGNYLIKIHSHDPSRIHLFTLYFLDSHARQATKLPWVEPDYDYIKPSQIEWFLNVSSSIDPIERPFQPDGASDLGGIWSRSFPSSPGRPRSRPSRIRAPRTLAKPNAMMFFHIPLPEGANAADTAGFDGEPLEIGSDDVSQGASKHNSGLFYNGIKKTFEMQTDTQGDDWSETSQVAEVKILAHGHSHNTDLCKRVDGIWICFDGGSSYSGYGRIGFDRRVRIYQISDYGEKVETYKRLTTGETIDRQILVGKGAAEGVGMDQFR